MTSPLTHARAEADKEMARWGRPVYEQMFFSVSGSSFKGTLAECEAYIRRQSDKAFVRALSEALVMNWPHLDKLSHEMLLLVESDDV